MSDDCNPHGIVRPNDLTMTGPNPDGTVDEHPGPTFEFPVDDVPSHTARMMIGTPLPAYPFEGLGEHPGRIVGVRRTGGVAFDLKGRPAPGIEYLMAADDTDVLQWSAVVADFDTAADVEMLASLGEALGDMAS